MSKKVGIYKKWEVLGSDIEQRDDINMKVKIETRSEFVIKTNN